MLLLKKIFLKQYMFVVDKLEDMENYSCEDHSLSKGRDSY